MMIPNPDIAALHDLYGKLTGLPISLDFFRERCWYEWRQKGFTAEDLRTVVQWLKKGIRENRRNRGSLRFSNLIQRLDYFEEDLMEAKAEARNAIPHGDKESVLKATGRDGQPIRQTIKTPADILAGQKAFEEFRRLKEML